MPRQNTTSADWKKMAELLADAGEAGSWQEVAERTLPQARALWDAELTILERFNEHAQPVAYHMDPAPTAFIAGLQPAFLAFWPEHPFAADWARSVTQGRVSLLSDRVSNREFRRTGLWNEVYIHIRAKNQVIMSGPIAEGQSWSLGMNRLGRDFGPRERELSRFLQPQLTRVFQRHLRRDRAQGSARFIADANTPFLIVDAGGGILEFSDAARSLFASTKTPLPVNNTLPGFRGFEQGRAPAGRIVRQSLGGLTTIGIATEGGGPVIVLLGRAGHEIAPAPSAPALTPREGEILHWIGEGKSNAEIGVLLGISPRTVGKHCERIFEKLGVENRFGAALLGRRHH